MITGPLPRERGAGGEGETTALEAGAVRAWVRRAAQPCAAQPVPARPISPGASLAGAPRRPAPLQQAGQRRQRRCDAPIAAGSAAARLHHRGEGSAGSVYLFITRPRATR